MQAPERAAKLHVVDKGLRPDNGIKGTKEKAFGLTAKKENGTKTKATALKAKDNSNKRKDFLQQVILGDAEKLGL